MEKGEMLILKAATVRALICSKGIRLAYRPLYIKFHESSATLLAHVNSYHHLSIGDLVDVGRNPRWLTEGNYIWSYLDYAAIDANPECYVSGFFEVSGRVIGGTQVRDIFCTLITKNKSLTAVSTDNLYNDVLKIGHEFTDPVALFWIEGLKKIQT